ncbi:unnamed protein product [Orchesella dallaii]|uniref:Methyl farnesoate epoxidase n=1 Tax=Orchesella dallaii TaxID=48710 RepID=A0ABP1QP39_9HEXA
MELFQVLLLLILGLIGWFALTRIPLLRKMAPGPLGLPIVGSLFHLLNNDAIEEFQKYKKKYGKVFSVSAGNFYITVVTDYRLIIDNLKKDEFQGRPDFELWESRNGGNRNRGVLFCEGPVWHEQRRFVLRGLRDFGFGKESMEGMLIHELQDLQNTLRKDVGKPVNLSGVFNASVLNSLWYIVTGNRFELTDPTLKTLITLLIDNIRSSLITTPALFFFWPVKYGLIGRGTFQNSLKFRENIKKMLHNVIDEHLETYKEGEIRDFVDAYIQQIKASSDGSSFYSEEGKKNLYSVLLDLFVAGAETTSTTLQWCMLYLSRNPRVQKKVQEEIDNVIGKSRPPNRGDKPRLIYLEAVLNEVHRMCSLVPFSVYHKATKDSEIGGYFIPKQSVVFFSIYDAHHDEGYWGDPNTFRPERFLDETETKLIRHEPLIPFSSGKRQCLGETLARDTLFLFFTGLLQTFSFEIDPECANNDIRGSPSFVSSPKPFKVIITERK